MGIPMLALSYIVHLLNYAQILIRKEIIMNSNELHSIDYFINKLGQVKKKDWALTTMNGACFTHCNLDETRALLAITGLSILNIDEGYSSTFRQRSAKGRIIALLRSIKAHLSQQSIHKAWR